MKTTKNFLVTLGVILFPVLSYANTISSLELEKQTKEWNILSDSFNSLSECTITKDRYNKEFTSYKRSDCFLHNNKYYYFICQLSNSCSVNLSIISWENTSSTSIWSIPHQQKLDAFLTKVKNVRKELNNDAKFETVLNQLISQLKTLRDNYKTNSLISQMINYLDISVQAIKKDLIQNKDVDTFFCQLSGDCENELVIKTNVNTNSSINTTNTSTNNTQPKQEQDNTNVKTNTTTGWKIKSEWRDTCMILGWWNIWNDPRLKTTQCKIWDIVYQRTNCTQLDIDNKEKFMWTYYECAWITEVPKMNIPNNTVTNNTNISSIFSIDKEYKKTQFIFPWWDGKTWTEDDCESYDIWWVIVANCDIKKIYQYGRNTWFHKDIKIWQFNSIDLGQYTIVKKYSTNDLTNNPNINSNDNTVQYKYENLEPERLGQLIKSDKVLLMWEGITYYGRWYFRQEDCYQYMSHDPANPQLNWEGSAYMSCVNDQYYWQQLAKEFYKNYIDQTIDHDFWGKQWPCPQWWRLPNWNDMTQINNFYAQEFKKIADLNIQESEKNKYRLTLNESPIGTFISKWSDYLILWRNTDYLKLNNIRCVK